MHKENFNLIPQIDPHGENLKKEIEKNQKPVSTFNRVQIRKYIHSNKGSSFDTKNIIDKDGLSKKDKEKMKRRQDRKRVHKLRMAKKNK